MRRRLMAVASWVAVLAVVSSPAVPPAEARPRFDLARTVARWDALARSITGVRERPRDDRRLADGRDQPRRTQRH
ncbi:hypothetical protein [Actinoplanes awajinensis]|uniref:hypothetical protein n=1 Tax=Actinoplanes awajinensis TaxID=135946 RepID=UPI0012FBC6F5|nr:hypothetical protein [Actinoplanes awajinensis]